MKKKLNEDLLIIANECNTFIEFCKKIGRSYKGNGGNSVKKFLALYNHRIVSKHNVECLVCKKVLITRASFNAHLVWCGKTIEEKENLLSKLKCHQPGHKLTEETKQKISVARKKYICDHGNNWKSRKEKSEPEIKFEFILRKYFAKDFDFEMEYTPPESERFFRIDFAVLKYKIGFEVNGNQHYNKDGTLRTYYDKRHKYLEGLSWKIVEIPSSYVFNNAVSIKLVQDTFKEKNITLICEEVDTGLIIIDNFRPKSESAKPKSIKIKLKKEKLTPNKRKCCLCKPPKETLEKLVWEMPTTQIAKQFNVSDSAVAKWCKHYGIKKPGRGQWTEKGHKPLAPPNCKKYLYLNPAGEEVIIENLTKFCRDNNLRYRSMTEIQRYQKGSCIHRHKTHKGWKFIKKLI